MRSFFARAWARTKSAVGAFATWEPAQFRALWMSAMGLALALGVTIPAELDNKVQGVITAAFVLIPLLQGLWTRRAVSPAIRVEALEKALTAATGRHAAPEPPHMPGTVGVDQPYPHQP